jgi:2-hydroxy-3-keto-5-methylthiopentenyl-1-phosphate phosphatase
VEALLEREGLEAVPRYAVKTGFTSQGITYQYPHSWEPSGGSSKEVCLQWGNCKCRALGEHRRLGHSIFYVGDGRSDFCPASIADQVFAHGPLAKLLDEKGLPYVKFHDFQDVIDALQRLEASTAESGSGSRP